MVIDVPKYLFASGMTKIRLEKYLTDIRQHFENGKYEVADELYNKVITGKLWNFTQNEINLVIKEKFPDLLKYSTLKSMAIEKLYSQIETALAEEKFNDAASLLLTFNERYFDNKELLEAYKLFAHRIPVGYSIKISDKIFETPLTVRLIGPNNKIIANEKIRVNLYLGFRFWN